MTNLSRVGKLGASQISFIREYKDALLDKKIITPELFDKFESLEEYLPTRYSEAHIVQFDEKQLSDFQALKEENDKKKAMQRGKECELLVMQQWLNENEGWQIIDEQVRLEKKLVGVDIPLIVTIDFIVEKEERRKIIEVKTKDLNPSSDWSVNAWEKLKSKGCPFQNTLQVNMQALFSDIHDMDVITAAVITKTEGKGKDKTFTYEISDNFTDSFEFCPMVGNAITQSVLWFDYELKNNKDELFGKAAELKTKADLEIDAFLEDYTATKEEVATPELAAKIARFQELKPLLKEAKNLEEEIKAEVKEVMGLSRKLKLASNSFELTAKFTKPAFYDEVEISAKIEKTKQELELAKSIEIGMAKSKPSLRLEINDRSSVRLG